MDRQAKLFVLMCTLFMLNDVAFSKHGKLWGCCGCSTVIGGVVSVYRGWSVLRWVWDLAELLQKDVTDPQDRVTGKRFT